MFQLKIRNIPVIQDGICLGIINIKDLADSSFSITETGGKKGFIHNISSRRGLPSGTSIMPEELANTSVGANSGSAHVSQQPVREVYAASYALPHPFKNSDSGERDKRMEHCNDLTYCEGKLSC
jgi:hypothetical protein